MLIILVWFREKINKKYVYRYNNIRSLDTPKHQSPYVNERVATNINSECIALRPIGSLRTIKCSI